jgi:hypothetical protein
MRVIELYSHPYRWASAVGSGWPAAKDMDLHGSVNDFSLQTVTRFGYERPRQAYERPGRVRLQADLRM